MQDITIAFIVIILVSPIWGLLYIGHKSMNFKQSSMEKKYIIDMFGLAFNKLIKLSEEMKLVDKFLEEQNKSSSTVDGIIENILDRDIRFKDANKGDVCADNEPLPPKPFIMPKMRRDFVDGSNHMRDGSSPNTTPGIMSGYTYVS